MIRTAIISICVVACTMTLVGWGLTYNKALLLFSYFPSPPLSYGGVGCNITDSSVQFFCRKRSDSVSPTIEHSWGGFAFKDEIQTPVTNRVTVNMRNTVITAPTWAIAVLFGLYPAIAFIRGPMRRWRRCRKGHCSHCGYDLTGNVSGVCSECNSPVILDR